VELMIFGALFLLWAAAGSTEAARAAPSPPSPPRPLDPTPPAPAPTPASQPSWFAADDDRFGDDRFDDGDGAAWDDGDARGGWSRGDDHPLGDSYDEDWGISFEDYCEAQEPDGF
jgi:hypothetical protein